MMGGGIPACSATLLLGAAGIGKTTLGLQFLSQCGPEQRGLFYGFYETPAALRAKAVALNLTAAELMDSGDIEVLWSPATEGSIDEVCARLLDAVRRSQVRRLFIDGLEALQKLATDPTRVSHILAALMAQLQRLGVSTVYTAETDTLVGETGPLAGVSMRGASSIVENVLSMRFANAGAHVYRMIAVIKVRDGHIDSRIRTFDIGDQGLKIDESHEHADEILSHEVQPRRASPSSRPSTGTSSNLPGD